MSTIVKLYANASAALIADDPNGNHSSAAVESLQYLDSLLVAFDAPDNALTFKKIEAADLYICTGGLYDGLRAYPLKATFDEETVTYNNGPRAGGSGGTANFSYGAAYKHASVLQQSSALQFGFQIGPIGSAAQIYTSRSANKPYLELLIDENTTVGVNVYGAQPASGYVPRAQANTFRWTSTRSAPCWGAVAQTSAVFAWRARGSAEEHTVSLTTEQSVTVAANTFPAGGIEWQVRVTANTGATASTAWMSLDTDEPTGTATPLAPVSTIVDGTADTAFRWAYEISTGTAQSAAELQISADGATWAALGTVSGADTVFTAPAGTLSAGTNYWRVRAANSEGAFGSWSAAAQIVVVAGPDAPAVSAPEVPLPTVSWQSDGQQAWELAVDGVTVAGAWGGGKSWTLTDPLPDGAHSIAVHVQNVYGLWSAWGTLGIEVANVPGSAITLSADASDGAAALAWTGSGYAAFRVLRDGQQIAETAGADYFDDLASAGAHSWQILGILANGNYTRSNAVSGEIVIRTVMLQDAATGVWLELPTARGGETAISEQFNVDVTAVQYTGRSCPTAEIGEGGGRTLTLRPAFPASAAAEAEALPRLLGKQLFYKDPHGLAFPAVIYALTRETDAGRIRYNLTLIETDGGEADA